MKDWQAALLVYNAVCLTACIGLGLAILYLGFNARATLTAALGTLRLMLGQCVSYLEQAKEWGRSAHVTQQASARATPELVQAIAQVPAKTADLTVEKIKSGGSDSGINLTGK